LASGRPRRGDALLDPVIHQETRLRILALLHKNREVSSRALRESLGLTEGNLGSHLDRLQDAHYVAQRHAVTAGGVETRFRLTDAGTQALLRYLEALRALLGLL